MEATKTANNREVTTQRVQHLLREIYAKAEVQAPDAVLAVLTEQAVSLHLQKTAGKAQEDDAEGAPKVTRVCLRCLGTGFARGTRKPEVVAPKSPTREEAIVAMADRLTLSGK